MQAVLTGYFGFDNCGDEAMLAGAIRWLRRHCDDPHLTVLSANPEATTAEHGIEAMGLLPGGTLAPFKALVRPYHRRTIKTIQRADVVFWIAGSGVFSDTRGYTIGRLWPLIRLLRRHARRLVFLSTSVGPINQPRTPEMIRHIVDACDAVCVRDPDSETLLRRIVGDSQKIVPLPDLALCLEPAPTETDVELDDDGDYLGVCIPQFFQTSREVPRCAEYKKQFVEAMADALDRLRERHGLRPLPIPFQHDPDTAMARSILGRMRSPADVFDARMAPAEMVRMLGRMRVVVGMRLHSIILTAMAGAPVVSIVYDEKIRGFLREIGQEGLAIDYLIWQPEREPFDADRLIKLVERAMADEDAIRHRIAERIEVMQNRLDSGAARLREMGIL